MHEYPNHIKPRDHYESKLGHICTGGGAEIKDSPVNVNPITLNVVVNITTVLDEVKIEEIAESLGKKIIGVLNGIRGKGQKELDIVAPVPEIDIRQVYNSRSENG